MQSLHGSEFVQHGGWHEDHGCPRSPAGRSFRQNPLDRLTSLLTGPKSRSLKSAPTKGSSVRAKSSLARSRWCAASRRDTRRGDQGHGPARHRRDLEQALLYHLAAPRWPRRLGWIAAAAAPSAGAIHGAAAMAGIDIALWDIAGKALEPADVSAPRAARRQTLHLRGRRIYAEGESKFACVEELASFVQTVSRGEAQDRRASVSKPSSSASRCTRGDRAGRLCDARPQRALRLERCIGFAEPWSRSKHLLARGAAALVFAAGRFVPPRRRHRIPLAHGEREWHRYTVRDFIDSGAIRYVQFDCTRYGGFTEALRIGEYAAQRSR